MKKIIFGAIGGWCLGGLLAAVTVPAIAQSARVNDRPPMYSYQTIWTLPRARWGDVKKAVERSRNILQSAMSGGTLIAYGHDSNLMHTPGGWTHADWWEANSVAGVFQVLDQIAKMGPAKGDVYAAATKQTDGIYVSHYYNWRPGSYKGLFTYIDIYQLKPGAAKDAMDTLSRGAISPVLEKLLADGTIVEYEIDEDAFHTGTSGVFFVDYMAQNPEDLLKAYAALSETLEATGPTAGGLGSAIDFKASRGALSRTNIAVFK